MNLRDRLAGLRPHLAANQTLLPAPSPQRAGRPVEELVPGEFIPTVGGPCFVATSYFPLTYQHGEVCPSDYLHQSPSTLAWLACDQAFGDVPPERTVFLDIETTGLAGGTGTYAFLVGIGYFLPGDAFVVRQFFHAGFQR